MEAKTRRAPPGTRTNLDSFRLPPNPREMVKGGFWGVFVHHPLRIQVPSEKVFGEARQGTWKVLGSLGILLVEFFLALEHFC